MKKTILLAMSILFLIRNTAMRAQSVAELTQQITAGKTTDSSRVEAIYDWLTRNIRYDDDARKRQRTGDTVLRQEPYNVVALKRAVCMGYAKTLREMCRISGIEAYVVEGFGKAIDGHLAREGHAWNAVKWGSNWHLVDATWDAATPVSNKKYFLMAPSVFVENHWPQDPMWQLLNAPISIDCFRNKADCTQMNSSIPSFNFSDTIRLWQGLDSAQQVYSQSIRIINFNANDLMALHNLAEYHHQKAQIIFAEYTQIRKDVDNKKRLPNSKNTVLNLLETSINCLKSAQLMYQKLANRNKNQGLNDASLNVELIQETLNHLVVEKAFVEQYFKD